MRWDERQVAMLAAMGIRGWAPALPVAAAAGVDAGAASAGDRQRAAAAGGNGASGLARTATGEAPSAGGFGRVGASNAAAPVVPVARWERPPVAAAAPTALGASEWHALAADAAQCTACGLCAGRTRSVFASGGPPADWLVVGGPPVEAEDRSGEPFAGKPGQLLDGMLRAVGVTRAAGDEAAGARGERTADRAADPAGRACLVLPVKCRPPGNRAPTPEELRTCDTRYLSRQIEQVRPKLILALGQAAALLLGSDEPLGKLRGRVHRHRGLPLVATYHPSYLLRNPSDKARAWEDLCLALETLRGAPA